MKKEVKIAFVAIIALACLFFGMGFLKGQHFFSTDDTYYITFNDITGVNGTCGVFADGVQVGTVTDMEYDYSHKKPTVLAVSINNDMRIPKGSSAEIATDLLGNTRINLLLSNNMRERVMPGETIEGDNSDKLMDKVVKMIPQIEKMVPKIDSILTSVNTILADPAIQHILANVDVATGNLKTTTAQANRLLAELNSKMPGILKKADGTLANTETFTGKLNELDLQKTIQNVNTTLADVQTTINKLNSTEGTIGKLLNDPAIFDNLNSTIQDADSLLTNIKAHPKRYVHFSLFGRKDK